MLFPDAYIPRATIDGLSNNVGELPVMLIAGTNKWIEEQNISNFIKLSGNKLLENLFVQKDIKGFEKDGFYVIKPNEYKNWHKAVSYLDFNEFKKAILNAGKKQWKN